MQKYVNLIVTDEYNSRIILESFLKINNINYKIQEVPKESAESFDCDFCTKANYFNQFICSNCNKKGCISHEIQCKCLPTEFTLKYRYSTSVIKFYKN